MSSMKGTHVRSLGQVKNRLLCQRFTQKKTKSAISTLLAIFAFCCFLVAKTQATQVYMIRIKQDVGQSQGLRSLSQLNQAEESSSSQRGTSSLGLGQVSGAQSPVKKARQRDVQLVQIHFGAPSDPGHYATRRSQRESLRFFHRYPTQDSPYAHQRIHHYRQDYYFHRQPRSYHRRRHHHRRYHSGSDLFSMARRMKSRYLSKPKHYDFNHRNHQSERHTHSTNIHHSESHTSEHHPSEGEEHGEGPEEGHSHEGSSEHAHKLGEPSEGEVHEPVVVEPAKKADESTTTVVEPAKKAGEEPKKKAAEDLDGLGGDEGEKTATGTEAPKKKKKRLEDSDGLGGLGADEPEKTPTAGTEKAKSVKKKADSDDSLNLDDLDSV